MKTIGFLQEQLPNGMITRSSNRLMCMIALCLAIFLTLMLLVFDFYTWSNLIQLVRENIIKPTDMKLLFGTNMFFGGLIFTLLTYAFGFKAYSKGQELKSINGETPVLTDQNTTP